MLTTGPEMLAGAHGVGLGHPAGYLVVELVEGGDAEVVHDSRAVYGVTFVIRGSSTVRTRCSVTTPAP
jgi:hypothetical protein